MIFHFRPIPRKTKKRVFSRLCRIGEWRVFTDEGRHTKRGGKGRLPALILFQSRTHNRYHWQWDTQMSTKHYCFPCPILGLATFPFVRSYPLPLFLKKKGMTISNKIDVIPIIITVFNPFWSWARVTGFSIPQRSKVKKAAVQRINATAIVPIIYFILW